ncbi:MAG: abortive infection system antitoxin AbiGi family protein [Candidatus Omnitrophota bacterium]
MAMSANSVFHFTNSLDNLLGILKNEFCIRYSLEETIYIEEQAIPMVCFCDIPLAQTKNHMDTYGTYGLGVSKKWAKEKGLNPVLYLQHYSLLHKNLKYVSRHAAKKIVEQWESKEPQEKEIAWATVLNWATILNIVRYVKISEGTLFKDPPKEGVKFYEERKWRYIPNVFVSSSRMSALPSLPFLTKANFEDEPTRHIEEKKLENYKLTFVPNDMKYVIVNNEDEISEIIKQLRTIKGKFPPESVDILCSRILTSEQIKKDF